MTYDVERLELELPSVREEGWVAHPPGFSGNSAVPLIFVHGEINDAFTGIMLPTPDLCAWMAAGKAWIFDSWKMHKVINGGSAAHLMWITTLQVAFRAPA